VALALAALVRAVIPLAAERAIPWAAAEFAGASARVGNVDFSLASGVVVIEDLAIGLPADPASEAGPSAEARLLELPRLELDLRWQSLLRNEVHIERLALRGVRLRLHQGTDGALRLPRPPADMATDASTTTTDRVVESERVSGDDSEDPEPQAAEVAEKEAAGTPWRYAVDRLELDDIAVALESAALDREVAYISAEQISVELSSYRTDGLGIGDLTFESPELRVDQEWLAGLGSEDSGTGATADPETPAEAGPAFSVDAERVRLNTGRFIITTDNDPIEVEIRLQVDHFGLELGRIFEVDLETQVGEGTVMLSGKLGISPLVFDGRVAWESLTVPPFTVLAIPELLPWLTACDAQGTLAVTVRGPEDRDPAGIHLRGDMSVSNLAFAHPETQELAMRWERLDIQLDDSFIPLEAGAAPIYKMNRLELTKPDVRLTSPPDAIDELLQILADGLGGAGDDAPEQSASDPGVEAPPALTIIIDQLSIAGATVKLVERNVSPPHSTTIHGLNVEASSLRLPEGYFDALSLQGSAQDRARFQLSGALAADGGAFDLELEELDLLPFSPFIQKGGITVRSGATWLTSHAALQGRDVRVRNHLVFRELDIDSSESGGVVSGLGMSLDLVMALLRRPGGSIELDVPVAWTEDHAEIALGPVLTDALREAITGAIMTPLKLIGAVIPDNAEAPTLEPILQSPGSADLTPQIEARLERLARLLVASPRLNLRLLGQTAAADRSALATQELTELAASGDPVPVVDGMNDAERRRLSDALRARARGVDPSPDDAALIQRAAEGHVVSEERLEQLATARVTAARSTLLEAGAPVSAIILRGTRSSDVGGVVLELGAADDADLSSSPVSSRRPATSAARANDPLTPNTS